MAGPEALDTAMVIFSLLFTKAEKNFTHFEHCSCFSTLEATHKPFQTNQPDDWGGGGVGLGGGWGPKYLLAHLAPVKEKEFS